MPKTGTFYVVNTTTPGTGVAGHAAPVAADLSTKPFIHLYNQGANEITVDYIRIRMTAIGAGATTTDFDVWTDQALPSGTPASTRSSGGTLMSPAIPTTSRMLSGSGAEVYFGPVVSVSVKARRIAHQRVRSVVAVVEDQYFFSFNGAVSSFAAAMALSGTAIVSAIVPFAPVTVSPGGNFELVQWGVSQSGAHSMDAEVGYWETPAL